MPTVLGSRMGAFMFQNIQVIQTSHQTHSIVKKKSKKILLHLKMIFVLKQVYLDSTVKNILVSIP